jgi:hypothetical protein
MSICLPYLTVSILTICKIITFKIEEYIWNEPLWILIPRWVGYMSTKSHTYTMCGTLRKSSISTRGYAEIHIQRPFFDNKNSIWKILGLKIRTMETCSSASSTSNFFCFWTTLKSWFLVVFQSFVFGQFWVVLGRFCYIDSS